MGDRINLTFHGVGAPARDLEPGEADVWLDVADFESVLDSLIGRDDVRITFDDGNASDVEHALPALERRGLTAAFFVVAGRLGEPCFLDDSGVRALAGAGMAIGCHGMRHRAWLGLGAPDLREELLDAKRILEDVVEGPVTEAACPFGSYDRRALRSLRDGGYRRVYTSDRGRAHSREWLQARNTVHRGDGAELVDRVLSEASSPYALVRRRAKRAVKRWR